MRPVETRQGSSPVILGLPHTGTYVPPAIWERLNGTGRAIVVATHDPDLMAAMETCVEVAA